MRYRTMNGLSYAFAVAVLASGVSALVARGNVAPATAANAVAVASPGASSAPSPAAVVDTKNFAYAPGVVTVRVGDAVAFTNSDDVTHTVTAADGAFDSGDMAQGRSWSHVFAKAGTYAYYCTYHRYMKGTVEVR